MTVLFFFFFFQAEDGIRDLTVTGVQTCALPISTPEPPLRGAGISVPEKRRVEDGCRTVRTAGLARPEPDLCGPGQQDRKSTRLNSSHSQISYAVFCLKKKKKKRR